MDINLVMFKGDGTRRDFPVTKPRTVIGRTDSCDLRIPVPDVSRKHCELVLEDDELVLRDLESSNGTLCNDKRVVEIELEPGDTIAVGPVRFVVQIEGDPAEVAPLPTTLGSVDFNVDVDDPIGGTYADYHDTRATEPALMPGDGPEVREDDGEVASVEPLVDDDTPIDLSEHIDESIELAAMDIDNDPVAALETMGDEVDSDDSGMLPRMAEEDRPQDGG